MAEKKKRVRSPPRADDHNRRSSILGFEDFRSQGVKSDIPKAAFEPVNFNLVVFTGMAFNRDQFNLKTLIEEPLGERDEKDNGVVPLIVADHSNARARRFALCRRPGKPGAEFL